AELVGRLLVRERGLQLGLPGRVGQEGMALGSRTSRVQIEELLRRVGDRLLDPRLRPDPLGAAELRELGIFSAREAADAPDLLDRQVVATSFPAHPTRV